MKKKTMANLIMCAIIAVIVTAGVLTVGHIRGWFDKADPAVSLLKNTVGVIRMERGGVSYPVESDTRLRAGDVIISESGATAAIFLEDDYITVGSNTKLIITDPAVDGFHAEVTTGEVFVNTVRSVKLTFEGHDIVITDATAALSVRSGAQTVSVFRGNIGDADAGQAMEYVGGDISVSAMQIGSLNAFLVSQIRTANESVRLCYTNQDLDDLAAKRQQALQEIINSATPTLPQNPSADLSPTDPTETPETDPAEDPEIDPTEPSEVDPTDPSEVDPTSPSGSEQVTPPTTPPTDPSGETVPQSTDPTPTEPTSPKPTEPTATNPTEPAETEPVPTYSPTVQPVGSCYITIRCDTILNNMEDLTPGKAEFVPADGEILPVVEVPFYDGETVFEALKRVCELTGIQLEYSWTPLYDSYYIEGINNLYEFDCGIQSGWMYKVNEWFPNYGCSSYELVDGDVIVWCYTCQGLGEDVGGPEWME